jgi:hypothetical protein
MQLTFFSFSFLLEKKAGTILIRKNQIVYIQSRNNRIGHARKPLITPDNSFAFRVRDG